MDLARLLAGTWFIWPPTVVVFCLWYATILGWIWDRRR
jgi:hypothetical protein